MPLSRLPATPRLRQLQQAHAQLILLGLAAVRSIPGHLLSLLARCPSPPPPHYPLTIYNTILPTPTLFASNNLLRCLSRGPSPRSALLFFSHSRRHSRPSNNFTFPFLLHACSRSPLLPEACQLHSLLIKLSHINDLYVRNALITFYAACGALFHSRMLFEEMPETRDVVTWNAILAGYARVARLDVAEELFERMPERDAISWSTMIMGYVQGGDLEKGMEVFREIIKRGAAVNEATLVTVLSASAQLGLLENGRFVHSAIKSMKFPVTLGIGTALVDMYAKCGCIEVARKVFDGLRRRDVFAWNAMMCGLAIHGMGKEVLDLFQKFISEGHRPTNITFVGVLNACSRAGLVHEGRHHFRSMTYDYGIEPEMEHYGCIVDLLARAGFVSEARELIEGMSVPPDPVLWGTLLGACKTHGLIDLGIDIGNKLLEVEPAHDGHYVLLAGIYAKARKWEDVDRVRKLMRIRGTSKVAGWSLIEACGSMHRFVAGDKEHTQSSEIYETLEMIEQRLAEAGYSADISPVLHDIGDEEKVNAIKEHSERLAIAFGLMVIETGQPIRIVKNLRVCGDCHEFSKMVTKVFDREIIVRDGSRFHHFKDGVCSCLDYW